PRREAREEAQPRALRHERRHPAGEDRMVCQGLLAEARPPPGAPHAPTEEHVLAELDPPPRRKPALEAAGPREGLAPDEEVRALEQAAGRSHPERPVEGARLGLGVGA